MPSFTPGHRHMHATGAGPQQRPGGVGKGQIGPGRRLQEKVALAPADRDVRLARRVGREQPVGKQLAPVDHFIGHRQNQVGMDCGGDHTNLDTLLGRLETTIDRDQADQDDRAVEQRRGEQGDGQPPQPAPPTAAGWSVALPCIVDRLGGCWLGHQRCRGSRFGSVTDPSALNRCCRPGESSQQPADHRQAEAVTDQRPAAAH